MWSFEPDFNLFLFPAVNKVTTKLREMGDRLVATNEDIQRSLTQGNTLTERAYADISKSYENLRNEVGNWIPSMMLILQIICHRQVMFDGLQLRQSHHEPWLQR